jgi:hypothetical protein
MLLELFIFFEIIVVALFLFAFFVRNEILWALTALFSGMLMISGQAIEYQNYSFNATTTAYDITTKVYVYPYLGWLNIVFFGLALLLGIFDIFDKYGKKGIKAGKEEEL